jgi:hypothetical protein
LEVCQRRYELRLERDGGSFSDLVQRKLEQELEALGEQVGRQDLVLCLPLSRLLPRFLCSSMSAPAALL